MTLLDDVSPVMGPLRLSRTRGDEFRHPCYSRNGTSHANVYADLQGKMGNKANAPTMRGTLRERVAALNMRRAEGQQQAALSTSRGVQFEYTCSEHCLQASSATSESVRKPQTPLQDSKSTALRLVLLRSQLIPGFRRKIQGNS